MSAFAASKRALFLVALLLGLAVPALAQVQSGNVYGTVASADDNSPMPGVTVELSGNGASTVAVTDAQGKFRFLGLAPGSYTVKSGARRLLADRADRRRRQHRPQHHPGDEAAAGDPGEG